MLSKIKSAASLAAETRPAQQHQQPSASDNDEDNDDNDSLIETTTTATNDTNNNNNNNNSISSKNQMESMNTTNNNNNNDSLELKGIISKTQDELMDIVETSRRRRLSKDSADSLTSFIRWSFGNAADTDGKVDDLANEDTSLEDHDASDRASSLYNNDNHNCSSPSKGAADQVRQQVKEEARSRASDLLNGFADGHRLKRLRSQAYSPEANAATIFNGSGANAPPSKRSSYLGSVVERLHLNQQQQQQQQHLMQTAIGDQPAAAAAGGAGQESNLSFHLQQFLRQQGGSLKGWDLRSSPQQAPTETGNGHEQQSEDNNTNGTSQQQQLVLAAAIHRALIDSVNGGSNANGANDASSNQLAADAKSTASSTGSSASTFSSTNGATMNRNSSNALDTSTGANNNNVTNLVDSISRQRRVYQTRAAAAAAAMQSLSSSSWAAAAAAAAQRQNNAAAAAAAAMSMNNHAQQHRHLQVAAALSALAGAGSRSPQIIAPHNQPHQQQQHHMAGALDLNHHHQHHPHPHHHLGARVAAAAAGANIGSAAALVGGINSMVDFECDTCGSSFDDRHRLMQHQSIHLELKKDWFTETPVDEVMKIFNRRRGEFLCNICNLRFEATLDYDQHNHAVHGPRPYCCQFCGNGTRTFKCWRQYLNHLYDHRYVFSCTIDDCDFTVNRRDSLRFHIFRFHLNCRLPQNQLNNNNHNSNSNIGRQSNPIHNPLGSLGVLDSRFRRDLRWQLAEGVVEDDADDTESEMNVAD